MILDDSVGTVAGEITNSLNLQPSPPPTDFQRSEMQYNGPPPSGYDVVGSIASQLPGFNAMRNAFNTAQGIGTGQLSVNYQPHTATEAALQSLRHTSGPGISDIANTVNRVTAPIGNAGEWALRNTPLSVLNAFPGANGLGGIASAVSRLRGGNGAPTVGSAVGSLPQQVGPVPVRGPAEAATTFAGQAAPYALGDIATGGSLTPAFAAQAALQAGAIAEQYQQGQIDGPTALKQIALSAGPMALPALARVGGALLDFARSPEGQTVLGQMEGRLRALNANEAGFAKIPGEPPVGPEGNAPAFPVGGEPANLPAPPERPMSEHLPYAAGPEGNPVEARLNAPVPPVDAAAQSIREWLISGKQLEPEKQQMFREQRAAQLKSAEQAFASGQGIAGAKAAAAGAFAHPPDLQPLALPAEQSQAVRSLLDTSRMFSTGERFTAHAGLDAMEAGKLPQPAQAALLSRIFGPEFIKAYTSKIPHNWGDEFQAAIGSPMTLLTSLSAHGPLNQRFRMLASHPGVWADSLKTQLENLAKSEDFRMQTVREMGNRPIFTGEGLPDYVPTAYQATHQHTVFGMERAGVGAEGFQGLQQNTYTGRLLRLIPGLQRSKEAYLIGQNVARSALYEDAVNKGLAMKVTDPKWYMEMGKMADLATGWGHLPNNIAGTGALFSPRNFFSKFEWPAQMLSGNPQVRMEAFKQFGAYAALTGTTLGALKAAGLNVNLDPKSGGFGQVQVGNDRINILRDYAPLIRMATQIITGEKDVPSSTGQMVATPQDWRTAIAAALHGQEQPMLGAASDVFFGYAGGGTKVSLSNSTDVRTMLGNLVTPIFVGELVDAIKDPTPFKTGMLPAAFLGASVSSYEQGAKTTATADKTLAVGGMPTAEDGNWKNYFKPLGPTGNADSFTQFRQNYLDYFTKQFQLKGMSLGQAASRASDQWSKEPLVRKYNTDLMAARLAWIRTHPDDFKKAIAAGLRPSKTELQAAGIH